MVYFVFKTVIKYIRLIRLQLPSFISNPKATASDSYNGQMEPQFLIGGSMMLGNMGVRCHG